MKITLFASLALLLVGASSYGQGTILFNNRTGSVDAPVRRPDGTGAGAGVTAGLFLVTESPGQVSLTPLFPTTTFRTTSAAAAFYLQQVTVEVPGHPAGSSVTVVMRNWDGPTYETSFWYGQSSPVTVVLGGCRREEERRSLLRF